MSHVEAIIIPKAKDLGDDFHVRRSLPDINKKMVGPFVFWDHMGPVKIYDDKQMKVRAHPHIGLATITWLFSGEIIHRDSLGNEQAIRPGEVNWMTAGKGIVHSERTAAKAEMQLEGIQLWLALPKEFEEVEPSFYHCKEEDVPYIKHNGIDLRLVAGEGLGHKSPVPVYSDLFYFNGEGAAGKSFHYDLSAEQEGAVYVVGGSVEIDSKEYHKFSFIAFKKAAAIDFNIITDARFMVFGGEVFPEKRHLWWNFVATSAAKIEAAKQRWLADEFGSVINEDEYIPLPDQ
jgi:hypothetical protein